MHYLIACLIGLSMAATGSEPATAPGDPFVLAAENGRQANEALSRSHRFVVGWLKHVDPASGLFPRNLTKDKDIWNAKDCAADNYPFMVLTCALTDDDLFRGRMLDILKAEIKLCSRVDRLPDTYSFSKHGFLTDQPIMDDVIFGSAEYCKDGLMPLTEWLGPSPWRERMLAILDDIWKNAPVETRFGRIPSTSQEVSGDLLQTLCRVFWTTGDRKYLEWAERLGDYYLLDHHPTRTEPKITLRDHGSEIVGGLSEVYVATHFADPQKNKIYTEPMHAMLDRILDVGRDEHGLFYNLVDLKAGKPLSLSPNLAMDCDTWGYVYNAFYAVYLVDGTERYRDAVRTALGNLDRYYRDYDWEHGSSDGLADSVEGAINLYNREPVASVPAWMDYSIRRMFAIQKPDGIVEGWHGDGNFARTAIMYALLKSQGATVRPWREDVCLGAVRDGLAVCMTLTAAKPWSGRIVFDRPRHKEYLHLPLDYPRINQFPEWFTTDGDTRYEVTIGDRTSTMVGRDMWRGVRVELTGESPAVHIHVSPTR